MLQMFSFMPPVACYAMAAVVGAGTFSAQNMVVSAGNAPDSRIYVVGGILAFLLAFVGYQRSLEKRDEAMKPTVSSDEVLQKLSVAETGQADSDLEARPQLVNGPPADSPLGRVRARSEALEV